MMLRIIFVTMVAGWFCWFLGKTVIHGLRTGAIRHTDSTRTSRRDQNPLGFWSLVIFFTVIVLDFAIGWLFVVADAVKKIQ